MTLGVVGREGELAEIETFLDTAGQEFAVLVLQGDAGIGKTTLWREARRRAMERGAVVLSCRPSATEAKFSFTGVADLLSAVDEEAFAALPELQRDALEVALLRAAPRVRTPFSRAVAAGFLTLVRNLAAAREVVLAVDDWQWLDAPSHRVLEFAARRLASEQVGLLCSIRAPVPAPWLGGAVEEERMRQIVLGSLSLATIGRIVAGRLGRSLPRPLLVRILEASGGNPFYALEVARLMADRDPRHASGSDLPVPDDLRKLTAARIRRLPKHTREALLLAAVLSTPDTRSVDANSLAPAEEAEVVSVDQRGRIQFVHPLFASAAYGSVPNADRQAVHRRAAEFVSDREQRARHLALGSVGADPSIAGQLDAAAALAAGRGAPDAAAELAELAADRTPTADAHQRDERLVAAAHFHFDAGDLRRAEVLARRVIAESRSESDRARALQLAAQLTARRSNFTEATELATRALRAAGEDRRLHAGIELDLVYCAVSLGDIAGAAPHARAAVAHAEAAGEHGMLGDALAVLTMAEFLGGQGRDTTRLERALALEDPLSPNSFMMRPRLIDGCLALWTGELDGALRILGGVYREMIERGQEGVAPMLSLWLVWAQLWGGKFELAARLSDEARESAALLDDATTSGLALAASALAHAHDGRTDLARAEANEALALFERLQWRSGVVWPLWALGLAALSEQSPAAVDAVLGPLASQVAQMGGGDPVLTTFLPDEIEALIELGQLDRAEAYLEPFEARAQALDRAWALAASERCRGILHAARGERDLAFASFGRALAAHERTAMPFERARTLLLAGQACRRFKQRGQAREALEEALAVFEQVGAPLWAARARSELARVGHHRPLDDELTATERRVAELAASGLSNQEISERAFVSVKTVEGNLTRVYRKLGVRSRVELANALRVHT